MTLKEKLAKSSCGLFVTLRNEGKQVVCIGDPFNKDWQMIEKALLEADEADELEISLLSPLRPIDPENLILGKHGILIVRGQNRALFLPHVPIEQNWDRGTFLEKLCLKADLPTDAWRKGIQAFETQVFTIALKE